MSGGLPTFGDDLAASGFISLGALAVWGREYQPRGDAQGDAGDGGEDVEG